MPQLNEIKTKCDKNYYVSIERHDDEYIIVIRPLDDSKNSAMKFTDDIKVMSMDDFRRRMFNPAMASLIAK